MLIDAHAHLADPALEPHLESILATADRFIQGGISPEDWERQLELARRYPGKLLLSFGLHPWWVIENAAQPQILEQGLEALKAKLPQAQALGELGLDFGKRGDPSTLPIQKKIFHEQLKLAGDRPVVLHIVKAHEEAFEILKDFQLKGLVHAFSSSLEIAERYIEMGFKISVGGGVLKKGFETLKRAVVKIPAKSLVIETDLDAMKFPLKLTEVAAEVARLRGETMEEVLNRNPENLYAAGF